MINNKLSRNKITFILTLLVLFLIFFSKIAPSIFYINKTDSMAEGVYLISNDEIKISSIVIATIPSTVQSWVVNRQYANKNTLLLKRVAALTGDTVCIKNHQLFINNQPKTFVRLLDSQNKLMPDIALCRQLKEEEFFLLGDNKFTSLDSRYLGIFNKKDIKKVVKPLLFFGKSWGRFLKY